MSDCIRADVVVSGRVQGVFFRAATHETAQQLGVNGWVRNLPDGRVEAVFEGPQDAVEAMINWCHKGSSGAQVIDVEVEYGEPEGLGGFQVR